MTGMQRRSEVQPQIRRVANDVRGAVEGWGFKAEGQAAV